jgi:type IV pilus assembly protein PilA
MKQEGGFSLIELLIVVAIILIIAAIAIPSLMRSRIAANESAIIGDIRTVITAEATFQSAAGGFGQLTCLSAPSDCSAGAGSVAMLDSVIATQMTKSGYRRTFMTGAELVDGSGLYAAFAYGGTPMGTGRTGIRGFAGGDDGLLCWLPNGVLPRPLDGPCANVIGDLSS